MDNTVFGLRHTWSRPVERAIVWATVVATIAWAVGASFLIRVPLAHAGVPAYSGGGPPNAQSFVPPDALIDINANEALTGGTVTTGNVSLLECTGTTEPTSCPGTTGSNLCTTATLGTGSGGANTRITCDHSPLGTEKVYRFRVGTGVQTASTNQGAAANVDRIFKTSGFFGGSGGSNTTPPVITPIAPQNGSAFPSNGKITLQFPLGPEGDMKTGAATSGSVENVAHFTLQAVTSGVPGGTDLCGVGCTLTWVSAARVLTITPSALTVGTQYLLQVAGLQNSASISLQPMPPLSFTASATDATAPALRTASPVSPANGAVNVNPYTPEVTVSFTEDMNPSTIALSSVRLCTDTTAGTAGCEAGDTRGTDTAKYAVRYDQFDRTARISMLSATALATSTKYCIEVVAGVSGVKDVVGNEFAATSSANCFTTAGSATDPVTGSPKLLFTDADNYKLVAKFTEAMRSADLITGGNVNTSNVELQCPVGVTINLTGKPATYRTDVSELEIQQLGLQNDQTCRLTVTTARDIAGNAMDTTNSANIANFKVLNATTTGGFLGTGSVQSSDFFGGMGGTAATFWEKPQRCQPRNTATGKSTSVECEFSVPAALATGSTFTLAFPSGFTMSDGSGNARLVPAAQSFMNGDINGPESGAVTLTGTTDTGAKTMTLTTAGAALTSGSMVHFELERVTTPASPGTDLRISVVVKDSSGVKVGQTIQPAPFTINQAGSLSIAGTVCKGTSSGGACTGSDTGIASVKVVCDQMGGYQVGATTAAFMGQQQATTDGSGDWSITGLTAGGYNCFLPPDPTRLADTGGMPPFQEVALSTTNKTDADFRLTDLSATGKTLTVNVTGITDADSDADDFDVFCHAGATSYDFSAPVMKAVDAATTGTTSTTLKLQGGKTYECGIGPHMAFEQFGNGAPPPPPTFTFMPPKPQQVVVPSASNPSAITFALATTDYTVSGSVVDGSSNGIANAYVHASPVGCFDAATGDVKECFGSFAQSKSDGTFTLNVGPGTYEIGADGPGLPPSTRSIATVTTANVSGVTLKMVKSSTTFSGTVKDESGNGIKYAHVNAERRSITSGSDACNFANSRPSGGFADSPTDENGNYTLYVASGTWCVRAFSPSYGEIGTLTLTMASTSLTGQDISASAGDYGTVSGTVTKGGTATGGGFVNCFGSSGGNHAQASSDGMYSMKLKAGTYTCDGFMPGVGPLPRASSVTVTANSTTTQNFSVGNPGTITVTITNITDAFCDARDSSGFGAPAGKASSTGVYTINVPAGTYTVRCGGPKYGSLVEQSGVAVTAGGTATVTGTAPTTRTVAGRVTDGSSNLSGVTLAFTDATTGKGFTQTTGGQTGTNNNLSATVPEGTYTLTASKQGYEPATTTATVSGGNLTLSSSIALTGASGSNGTSVTVGVQESSVGYTGSAKVIATKTSGSTTKTVVAAIDTTAGNASLPLTNGTWTVKAIGDNGKESSTTTVTVSGGVLSGSAPTLSLANTISGYTQKSGSETLSLSAGGLLKFNDLAVGGKTPEVNIPASSLSTSDSSTGKVEMKSDSTLKDIDPGTDANFVGSHGYDITPKDANGNEITSLNGTVTITVPYTDADVSSAGVDESKLQFASFDAASQTWETFPTTVDTTNNTLTATVSHFSSFGVIGSTASGSPGGSGDATPPAAVTNISATATSSGVTLTWKDATDSDFDSVEVLRSIPPSTSVSGTPVTRVAKGTQRFVDTGVTAGKTYTYILRSRDVTGNTKNSGEISVSVPEAGAAPATGTVTAPPATGGGGAAVTTPTTTPVPTAGLATIGVAAGDRVKMGGSSALYLVGADGKRYVFPNEATYKSWYGDFAGTKALGTDQLATLPLGGVVTMRPGTWLVKIESDPKVYAVEPGGVLRWVETEERARSLFGTDWNRQIVDVPVSFWVNYRQGDALGATKHPTGTVIRYSGTSAMYYIDAGKRRAVSTDTFASLGLQSRFIREVSSALVYEDGPALTGSANLRFAQN